MKPHSFMVIAGEASGDVLAAELVHALRQELSERPASSTTDFQPLYVNLEPRLFGAGGPRLAAAGVEMALDLAAHSVVGLSDVLKHYLKFRRFFWQLFRLALLRQPEAIICVDFSEFNRRLAHAIRRYTRRHRGWFHDWEPKLIQFVSPQVWASRAGRAYQMAADYDLLLSIFPFEKAWYAKRVPKLRVEFVGHPLVDRHPSAAISVSAVQRADLRADFPVSAHRLIQKSESIGQIAESACASNAIKVSGNSFPSRQTAVAQVHPLPGCGQHAGGRAGKSSGN